MAIVFPYFQKKIFSRKIKISSLSQTKNDLHFFRTEIDFGRKGNNPKKNSLNKISEKQRNETKNLIENRSKKIRLFLLLPIFSNQFYFFFSPHRTGMF